MSDIYSSPGEPAFFLHHNYIDRLWCQWQQANPEVRFWQMNGNIVNQTEYVEPATGWGTASLDYELSTYGMLPNVTIATVMNVQGGYLCCEYDYQGDMVLERLLLSALWSF
jgi:tyrosinase